MNDAFGVRGFQSVGNFDGQRNKRLHLHRASVDNLLERGALEIFHGDKRLGTVFADVVDGTNIGVIQRRSGFGFATETTEGLWIASDIVRKKFQRNETVQALVLRLVNHSHAAAAELFEDEVMRDSLSDQRRGRRHCAPSLVCTKKRVKPMTSGSPRYAGNMDFHS